MRSRPSAWARRALTARRFGADDVEGAGRVLTNSAAIAVVLGIIASIIFFFLAPLLLPLINNDPAVVRLGVPFLQYRYAAVASMVVTASYKAFFDGLGRTDVHFKVALLMNAINFLLNVALIFGKWGFPRMGVAGSGLALVHQLLHRHVSHRRLELQARGAALPPLQGPEARTRRWGARSCGCRRLRRRRWCSR